MEGNSGVRGLEIGIWHYVVCVCVCVCVRRRDASIALV